MYFNLLCSLQENSSVNTSSYKFGFSEPESFTYYDYSPGYPLSGQVSRNEGQDCHFENSQTLADNEVVAANMHREDNSISTPHANSVECEFIFSIFSGCKAEETVHYSFL